MAALATGPPPNAAASTTAKTAVVTRAGKRDLLMSRPLTRGLDPNLPAAPSTPDGEARRPRRALDGAWFNLAGRT
ncbi:hypothetical protein Amsp01_096800 [Amycolatopsis sp. NBRC 101858]|nr:hypothetical protein Amsp01_096800 [Amycolatopsis sp. NBRC 101858]